MELKFKAIHPKIGREIPLPQFATPGPLPWTCGHVWTTP